MKAKGIQDCYSTVWNVIDKVQRSWIYDTSLSGFVHAVSISMANEARSELKLDRLKSSRSTAITTS